METISLPNLVLGFIPALVVLVILFRWSLESTQAIVGLARMLIQLLIVGYLLVHIFDADTPWVLLAVLSVMLLAASWIALRPLASARQSALPRALIAIGLPSVAVLLLMTVLVLRVDPWWHLRTVIPLAGMVFANAMNCVSLAAERFESELRQGAEPVTARNIALRTALIPITNSLYSVGIVSLPGMMTGQILSGVSPLIAARYQIMVMCMLFGAGGLAAILYLTLMTRK